MCSACDHIDKLIVVVQGAYSRTLTEAEVKELVEYLESRRESIAENSFHD